MSRLVRSLAFDAHSLLRRWKLWLHRLSEDLRLGRPYDAPAWHTEVLRFTLDWSMGGGASLPLHPTGEAVQTAAALCVKWDICTDITPDHEQPAVDDSLITV